MKFSLIDEQPCLRTFGVEMDGGEWAHARDHAVRHLAERVQLPGFRKGKVPAQVLEQRWGRELEQEAVEHAVGHAAREVLERTNLVPVANPTVTRVEQSAAGLRFQLTIELAPQIVLGEYRGFDLIREPVIVRPEDVDGVIEGLRRRSTTYAAAGRPARWGDLAIIDYDGTLEGRPFEGATGRDVLVFVGAGDAMPELERALVGRAAGDAFTTSLAYSPDHANAALAGKTAELAVRVKEVKHGTVPDANDEFAASVGPYRTADELRKAVREKLAAEREREARERLRASVVERLLRFAPSSVAPSLVDQETQAMAVRGVEELARTGIRRIEQLRMTPQAFRELYRPSAIRAVREAFVLEAISRREGITVTDEDVEGEIKVGREPGKEAELDRTIAALKADGRWTRLKTRLLQDRTLDWVIGRAKVVERAVSL